ncbi:MAG: TetR/AcrR family transcriptional regulator [Actinomycetota bacterium]
MPKIVDHDQRRAAIAAAAADAIAADGIEAVTMKGIAERAGVTTGAVTHYFTDKDAVLLEALLLVDASMQRRLDEALTLGRSPTDALLAALPHDAESRRDWCVWRVFSDRASRSDELRRHYRTSTEGWLRAASDSLTGRSGSNEELARLDAEVIVGTVDAIGDAASVDPAGWPVERQRRILDHLLARFDWCGPVEDRVGGDA